MRESDFSAAGIDDEEDEEDEEEGGEGTGNVCVCEEGRDSHECTVLRCLGGLHA